MPYSIDADDEGLVLNGTRRNKAPPMRRTAVWPASHIKQQVVGAPHIARPDRKAQVVTDHRAYFPAIEFHNDTFAAGREHRILLRHAKQVAFVVLDKAPTPIHPHPAIVIFAV